MRTLGLTHVNSYIFMRELIRVLCMYSVLTSSNMSRRARILVVGSGGIGTIAALNLHVGGACHVTMVLRSSYQKVLEDGFSIDSFDHGKLEGWKPDSSKCFPTLTTMILASQISR